MENKNQLKRTLTFKYTIALFMIATLAVLAFLILNTILKNSDSTGYIVNISGKQRMLSQHIALDAHRINNILKKNADIQKSDVMLYEQVLKQHTKELKEANTFLSTGKLPNNTTISLSPSVYNMYFGEINLAHRVEEYAAQANKLTEVQNHQELLEIINFIDRNSESLLMDMNKVVNIYQREGEEKLNNMQSIEVAVLVLTLMILLLEVIFIFQPMVQKIMSLLDSKQDLLNNLEETVELRTIKLEQANEKLEHLAFHDFLTGLRNRLTLETDIETAIKNKNLHKAPYAVLMLDIDWFKDVNDTYGHAVGDEVLKKFSKILLSSVREGDKVYRAGGEEFVVLLHRIGYKDTIAIAEKIKDLLEAHIFTTDEVGFSKTVSIGLYHSSMKEMDNVHAILQSVDTALYTSKENGRNRITNVF
ncbi:MAG: GGDEF domain-containing protein [Campylobacterota bacterium]|nr:GGDEF domain-containing protein [Campylobacterota bacterium]